MYACLRNYTLSTNCVLLFSSFCFVFFFGSTLFQRSLDFTIAFVCVRLVVEIWAYLELRGGG